VLFYLIKTSYLLLKQLHAVSAFNKPQHNKQYVTRLLHDFSAQIFSNIKTHNWRKRKSMNLLWVNWMVTWGSIAYVTLANDRNQEIHSRLLKLQKSDTVRQYLGNWKQTLIQKTMDKLTKWIGVWCWRATVDQRTIISWQSLESL